MSSAFVTIENFFYKDTKILTFWFKFIVVFLDKQVKFLFVSFHFDWNFLLKLHFSYF